MDAETIALLIKWGPLALVGIVFLYYFINGLIKGTYKVLRRLGYVLLFVLLSWIFIDNITAFVLDFNIPVNDMGTVREMLVELIESNEDVNKFLGYAPELKSLVVDHPEIILSPILFIVLVLIVLPLSFPIYWIYLLIWHIFAKYVFKRQKYEKDENGEILRNEKGKKIKVARKKRRLLGGLVYGVQGIFIICTVLLPVNFVNRIYNKAKDSAELEKGETLCSSIEFAEVNSDICKYLDIYNETIFAKLGGEKSLDKVVNDSLTTVKIEGDKVSLENELSNVAVSAVLLNESGLIKLLMDGVNLDTLDLSVINFDKINEALDVLFGSYTLQKLSEAGVNYVLNEVLDDKLVEVLKDDDIVSKLEYEDYKQIRDELKNVVNVIKYAVDKEMDKDIINNKDNVVGIVNELKAEDVENLINKLLSLRIVSKAMPSVLKAYAEEYGVNVPENMTTELNNEITNNFGNAVKFVQTMDATKLEDITEGNIVDNLSNLLFNNGVLKTDSKDSLATLLHDFNSSYLFKDLVPTLANKMLEGKDYKIDARVLKYVTSKEAWLKELAVLEKGFDIYSDYDESETIYYDKVTGLLNEISGTKVMISILPFAYDELLPKLGLEIDSSGFPSIDFGEESEDSSKAEFYETWEEELVLLKNIADAFGELQLQSLEDISVDLLNDEDKVESLSVVMGEVYKSNMLKEPFVDFMKDTMNDFIKDFGIEFSKEELLRIDTKDKWHNEFSNINKVLSIDFNDENNITATNLKTVFDAVDSMTLFNEKKITILKYAVENSGFLSEEEMRKIEWPDSTSQEEIDTFYDNETGIFLKIVDKKDTIESLGSLDLTDEGLNTAELGSLIDDAMDSSILSVIVVDKMVALFESEDVNIGDDRDYGTGSNEYLVASIKNVGSWQEELDIIKGMLDIKETNFNEEKDGKTRVEQMFIDIEENSDLLVNMRASILMRAVSLINMDEADTSNVNVDELMKNDYAQYDKEVDVIVSVSKNKTLFEEFGDVDLVNDTLDPMGELLDKVMNSIIFNKYAINELANLFIEQDIRDDRDEGSSTTKLKEGIGSIGVKEGTSWVSELNLLQSMLNVKEENFNQEVSSGVTRVEQMFDDIENSDLLVNMRANILMKAVNLLAVDGVNTSYVSVNSLKAIYNSEEYYQYHKEVDVLVTFAENKSAINDLVDVDISNLDSNSKATVATLLDSIKLSDIFKDKYVSLLDGDGTSDNPGALSAVRNNSDLASYGVSVKTKSETNNYRDISWANEIENIDVIIENIGVLKSYNGETIKKDTDSTTVISIAETIGTTLDAVGACDLLSDGADKVIANKVIKQITGVTPDPELTNDGSTWTSVFEEAINAYIIVLNTPII